MTIKPTAIQETYGEAFQYCWGCGPKNDQGLHLQSYPAADQKSCVAHFTAAEIYSGGIPDYLFGGLVAMLFDCHGTASAAYFSHVNKGLDFNEKTVIGRFITAHLEVDFKKPTPLGTELTITGRPETIGERKVVVRLELAAGGELKATAKMVAVAAKSERL